MTTMTIRMGAAHWDATIYPSAATNVLPIRFNFRKMTRDERRVWYRTFMDSVRAVYGKGPEQRRRPRRRPRRSKARSRRGRTR